MLNVTKCKLKQKMLVKLRIVQELCVGTFLNVGIVLCSIVESYIFPFVILKWLFMVTKFCGFFVTKTLRDTTKDSDVNCTSKLRFSYTLLLSTRHKEINTLAVAKENLSHICFVIEQINNLLSDDKWNQLCYCGQDCQRIPTALGNMYGAKTQHLDLSYNCLETLKGLEQFTKLEELILDNNKLTDNVTFPHLHRLKTISLNNNQITDLEAIIEKLKDSFPSLSYLSLLSNKACPNQLSHTDKDDSDYQRYRYYVIYKLSNLRFLDSRRVSSNERQEANTRGEFMRVRRPAVEELPPLVNDRPIGVRSLRLDLAALGKHKGAYGRCNYKYTGKHSEGNRFILNSDL